MDPITAQLLALGGQGLLTLVGDLIAGKSEEEARKIMLEVLNQYRQMETPDLEMAEDPTVDPLEGQDQEYDAAQRDALRKLRSVTDSGGLTPEMQAMSNEAMGRVARQERSGRQAIQENMAARGMGGSGDELAMKLANQQNAAEGAQRSGEQLRADAYRNWLQGIRDQAGVAGSYAGQDLNERLAQSRIQQYNAEAGLRGTQARNQARQQGHQNDLGLVDRQAGVQRERAGGYRKDAEGTRAVWSGLGAGVSKFGKFKLDDEDKK
jgi:hypothetical protein